MNDRRNGVYLKLVTWIFAEIILNLVGFDNLADYSEFIFDSHSFTLENQTFIFSTRFLNSGIDSQINLQVFKDFVTPALFASFD